MTPPCSRRICQEELRTCSRRYGAETIKIELPEGFQTAEFLLEHGFVDMIVDRKDLRSEIARLIDYTQK